MQEHKINVSPWKALGATQRYHRLVEALPSQQQVLRRVVPLFQLLQVNVFYFPSKKKNIVTRTKWFLFYFLPLCQTCPVTLGDEELLGGGVGVEAPGVAPVDQPLVLLVVPATHQSGLFLNCWPTVTSRPGCRPARGSCRA